MKTSPLTTDFEERVRAELPEIAARMDAQQFEPVTFAPVGELMECSRCRALVSGRDDQAMDGHKLWHSQLNWGLHVTAMMLSDLAGGLSELGPILAAAAAELATLEEVAEP